MTDNNKVDIYQILNMFNEEVGYEGLDNEWKTTDERDDVITRQTFNNWLREYNQTNTRKIQSKKIDQFNNEWLRIDIEKLIKTPRIQKRLKDAYLRETVPLFSSFETSKRVSKKYEESFFEVQQKGLEEAMQYRVNNLIDEIIKGSFMLKLSDKSINVLDYINKNKIIDEYIDMEKVVEEAFKIEDGFYEIPVYNDKGTIVDMKQWDERPDKNYFLKNKK